jgi:hypothetical protein
LIDVFQPLDPDWTPYGTSFGLRWSPWLESEDSRTCVLSFTGHHYVGFRKVTIRKPWVKGKPPDLEVEDHDTYGLCLHLSTDSFVEFEDAVCGSQHKPPLVVAILTNLGMDTWQRRILPRADFHRVQPEAV